VGDEDMSTGAKTEKRSKTMGAAETAMETDKKIISNS